jgi:hypothetical protein
VEAVHAWNSRKRMFSAEHIKLAVGRLQDEGWGQRSDGLKQ